MEHCIGTACATATLGQLKYRTEITGDNNLIIADEPKELGGGNEGMNPTVLLLASLGSCTAITLKMYADRKNWQIDKITVDLTLDIVKSDLQQTTFIKRHIRLEGNLTEKEQNRMLQIADQCPLHKILSNPVKISTNILTD